MKVTSDVNQKFHPTTLSITFEKPEELASFYLYMNIPPATVGSGNDCPGMTAKFRMSDAWWEVDALIKRVTGASNPGEWAREYGLKPRVEA